MEENKENNQEEDSLECQYCRLEGQLVKIKYGIISQILEAGLNFKNYYESCLENGVLSEDKKTELQTRYNTTLNNYFDVVNLVWNEDIDEDCDDCSLNPSTLDSELKDILDKKKDGK
jgi:hypothetical protein